MSPIASIVIGLLWFALLAAAAIWAVNRLGSNRDKFKDGGTPWD